MLKVIEHYDGHANPYNNGWQSLKCINPDHDDRIQSATTNIRIGAYKCFSCDLSAGSPEGLIGKIDGLDTASAREKLQAIAGGSYTILRGPARNARRSTRTPLSEDPWDQSGNRGLF